MRRTRLFAAFAVTVGGLIAACSDDPTAVEPVAIEDTEFAASLNIDLALMTMTATGLYFQDLVEGEGDEAELDDFVSVDYTLWLPTGQFLETSTGGQPFQFTIGSAVGTSPILGWHQGVRGMKVGGTRKLIVPHNLAYGSEPRGASIPAYGTLVFDVTLVANQGS